MGDLSDYRQTMLDMGGDTYVPLTQQAKDAFELPQVADKVCECGTRWTGGNTPDYCPACGQRKLRNGESTERWSRKASQPYGGDQPAVQLP